MGKFSRNKGMRGEYTLRDYLRGLGYSADRVPLSGASQGFKGDVIAYKEGTKIVFELKCRAKGFEKIYEAMESAELACADFYDLASNTIVKIAYKFDRYSETWEGPSPAKEDLLLACPKFKKCVKKILGMKKLLGGADYLVIKGDRKPLLFMKFIT